MAGISYRKIRKGLRRSLAPADPGRYSVRGRPEDRFYFRFKLVFAGLVVLFGVLLLPEGGGKGMPINEVRLRPLERLAPGKAVVMLCINYMKERK